MAVDYVHRLVVWGRPADVRSFAQAARRRARYGLPGKQPVLTEVIPFSFEALWKRQPQLRRFASEAPFDPYHLRAWRTRAVRPGVAFVRYQFQTRSMEMQDIVRLLSLGEPRLTFVLVTLCLDACEVQSWFANGGRATRYVFPDARLDALIRDARSTRTASAPTEDDLEMARDHAEFAAIEEAMHRWDGRVASAVSPPAGRARRRAPARTQVAVSRILGRYAEKPLEWFDVQEKRDRQTDLTLLLLDDTRRNPELRKALGLA